MPTTPTPETPEMGTCRMCGVENRELVCNFEGGRICETCEERTLCCEDCEVRHHEDDGYGVRGGDYSVCRGCYEENYFTCERCDYVYHIDDLNDDDGSNLCPECSEGVEQERNQPRQRSYPVMDSQELQSADKGKIIKSRRKFGVELECLFSDRTSLRQMGELLNRAWGFSSDGSIRASKDAVGTAELVSPIMQGKAGEDEIKKLSSKAYDFRYFVNSSCGFHLHLDAPEFVRDRNEDTAEPHPHLQSQVIWYEWDPRITPYGNRSNSRRDIPRGENGEPVPYQTIVEETDNRIPVNRGKAFIRLRNLFYVYVAFDDIFRGMQPPGRRRNRFCHATSSTYSLDAIRDLDDYGELERLFYKVDRRLRINSQIEETENRKGHGKDGSRYVGFNIEPLLRQNGPKTVELRHHSPTLNAEKILRWTDIHQTILDHVAKNDLDLDRIDEILAKETHLINKAKAMCELFGIARETSSYIVTRLMKFNRLNVAEEDVKDEEVEPSDVGQTAHSRRTSRMRHEAGVRHEEGMGSFLQRARTAYRVTVDEDAFS
jgi:hypothetical protein